MKKLIPIITVFALLLAACDLPGMAPQPTAVSLPTAVPTTDTSPNAAQQPNAAKAGDTRTAPADGMQMIFIPSGSFYMGGVDKDAQPDEKPAHNVTMSGFWMDKIEVSNGMFTLCVQAGACKPPREFKSATRANYFGNPDFSDYPVIYMSWQDATNYCKWAGRRLPSEAEWEYAARGSADYRRYPWGEQSPDSSLANFDYTMRDTSRVGNFPSGASPFGILDQAGNVWEWVADFYSAQYYASAPGQNPPGPNTASATNGPRRVLRGGSWADNFKDARVSNRGFALAPDLAADSRSEKYLGEATDKFGFRCAANANN